jgi:guanosine-3',5'-bis(diphosphate) 3'-pyrophosphohydrolase
MLRVTPSNESVFVLAWSTQKKANILNRVSSVTSRPEQNASWEAVAQSDTGAAMPDSSMPIEPAHMIKRLQEYYPDAKMGVVEQAYALAQAAHGDQRRSSGDPYIAHPIAVAHILIDLKTDPASIAAGLLHDVVEDTGILLDDIRQHFGEDITMLVDGLTKFKAIEGRTKEEAQASSYRKMFIAMADDPRVVLIKLADRLHNMRTLQYVPEHKQQRIAAETLDIYAPLAHRLGVWQIKWELEDLALRYLHPDEYKTISRQLQMRREARERIVHRVISRLRQELEAYNIPAEITGRPKHIYSIWRKMKRKNVSLDQIYDQLAVRVIVNTIDECYRVLGIVHQMWMPIPNEFDDYISRPKESMYQSLHTTLMIPDGQPCEIQIRTHEMHEIAEHGIAAHWRYKEGIRRNTEASFDAKLQWLRNLIAWQREIEEDKDFLKAVKDEMREEPVYVFTPKGKIIDLPQGSTPIDFAYRIHSDVGNHCIGARVNNQQVPLHHQLQNGDVVNVITSKQKRGPSRDWLEFVRTSSARNHIRRWFRRQERDLNISAGRDLLERELKRLGMTLAFDEVAEVNGFKSVEDLFLAIGVGDNHPRELVRKVIAQHKATAEEPDPLARLPEMPPRPTDTSKLSIQVRGASDIHKRLARCCSPVEGDPVVGYITRGRGMTIHRMDCHNVLHERDRARLIEASWGLSEARQEYPVPIRIDAWDRKGLWRDISGMVADAGIDIQGLQQVKDHRTNRVSLIMTLMVDSLAQLTSTLDKLNRIPDVIDAHRERTQTV